MLQLKPPKREIHIPELSHISSKGQIVIPKNYRNRLKLGKGDAFAIYNPDENTLVLKKIKAPEIEEDITVLKEIDEAWGRIARGEYRKAKVDDFLKELDQW